MACESFEANIFNKSKCQNCFKSRELHVPAHPRMENAKALYAGWLCLAPEGTDFEKTPPRSRRWQRRFFVLYEHGVVTFALDDLPSTLPQGTLDMKACTAILDAEARTGQKNTLCIVTTLREVYIRADSKDTINGWGDRLVVFVQANATDVNEKHKADAAVPQEPSPAKMAAPGEEPQLRKILGRDVTEMDPRRDFATDRDAWDIGDARRSFDSGREPIERESRSAQTHADVRAGCDAVGGKRSVNPGTERRLRMCLPRGDGSDGRPAETEPDLFKHKKGWLVKLDEDTQWRKYWFVLSADRLTFYRDIAAEEASEQEGQVDLSECSEVSERQVHKNYGLQIRTPEGVCTLSAATPGIRRNWIRALVSYVRAAPDVTGLSGAETVAVPGGPLTEADATRDGRSKPRSVLERRREGRYKTFDWADFRPPAVPAPAADAARSPAPPPALCSELDKKRRREARRRRYESILGLSPGREVMGDAAAAASLKHQMEACWKQVERKSSLKNARILRIDDRDKADSAHDCEKALEDLKRQLELSERCRQELEARLRVWTSSGAAATLECLEKSGDELDAPGHATADPIAGKAIPERHDKDLCKSTASASSDDQNLRTDGRPRKQIEDGDARERPGTDAPPRPDSEGDRKLAREARFPVGRKEDGPSEAERRIPRLKEELPGKAALPEKERRLPEVLPENGEAADAGNGERSLLRRFRATEAKMTEMERKLRALELSCDRLRAENRALKEAGTLGGQNAPQNRALGPADQRTQRLLEWTLLRWKVLDRFLEVADRPDVGKAKTENREDASRQLKPEELWSGLSDGADASRLREQKRELPDDAAPRTIPETQMTAFGRKIPAEDESPAGLDGKRVPDVPGSVGGASDDPETGRAPDSGGVEFLGTMVQIISSWMDATSSGVREKAGMTAERLRATFIFSTEAAFCCHVTSKCDRLLEENAQLRQRLSLQETRAVDGRTEWEDAGEGEETASTLMGRVRDLEERLAAAGQSLASDRIRHDREMQKMKAECERSLVAMEDCHAAAVEELQRRHLREAESLLAQRDQMLKEEAVATAIAMEAVERAHRVELDREVQRRCQTLNVTGNALMEEVYKQHSEELAGCQRELADLSYRFTLKCVEMAQVTEELDAQRETLSRQQKENQDLMEQNQELSAQLAAEVRRLDQLPADGHAAGLYKMELLLRVKESQLRSARRQSAALRQQLREAQSRPG
ncbi:myosin phosphatase Rho-interacting protein-like isoform X2 [Corythoichthys intestinalis]|uniref:myosin phosphatase Rho-interacting protein-like isoform X2 n=1 Tax=Corythoichthys intestinalis TaxID=161448 RepID=UPI0025A602D9|nr:myosin phosphatase Rho-interacting protein-like isoform X2 [Corythoichthys intestinalis]